MKRRYLIGICSTVIVISTAWIASRSALVDRVAPWRSLKTDYARLPLKARQVDNVLLFRPSGAPVGYRVSFLAWGEDRKFVAVDHKGRFVKSIRYLDVGEIPAGAQQKLSAVTDKQALG